MKRSEINALVRSAQSCFEAHGWSLPPNPRWDVTDFGLGNWREAGLILVNLAEEPEYCEKLMYAMEGMVTPAHCHRRKKEDIICRWGRLAVQIWAGEPGICGRREFSLQVNREPLGVESGQVIELPAGHRVTLLPGVYHAFFPLGPECIIGEVSTANDDTSDNFFVDPGIGRFPCIEEDEPAGVRLAGEKTH